MEIITQSAQETQKLGEKLAVDLKPGTVIALYGDLGSGKTTFIQGLARGLGIKKRIISPSFVFIRQYEIRDTRYVIRDTQYVKRKKSNISLITYHVSRFFHVDLYRIEKTEEAKGLGLEEIFADKKAIAVIEWADRIKEILPKKRIEIYFKYLDENKRRIKVLS